MLNFSNRRIFVARASVDMRRGIDTLCGMVSTAFQCDPYVGDVFVFLGRDRKRVKILVWDQSGFWLAMKRLERGTFATPGDPAVDIAGRPIQQVSAAELQMVLEGIAVHRATYHAHYHRTPQQELHSSSLTTTRVGATVPA